MKENIKILKALIRDKMIYIPLILVAICAYGFYITHYSIGVDDTSITRYYIDGYAHVVGRYTIYLLNKIVYMAEFSPFILEFLNVLLLMFAAVLWMILIKKIIGNQIPVILYTIFGCVFITFPLFNEIFVYNVHGSPGMALGYLLVAFSSLSIYTYLVEKQWKKIGNLVYSIVGFYFALGIYESFTIVYIMACATIFFLYTLFQKKHFTAKEFFVWMGIFILPIIIGIVLRSFTCWILLLGTDFPNRMRELSGFRWIFAEGGMEQFKKVRNEFIGMYFVNGLFYLPIRNYILSIVGFFVYALIKVIREKNGWIFIGALGILVTPCLIIPIEGVVTPYRANLGLAFSCALSIMLIANEIYKRIKFKWVIILVAFIIVYNQAFDLNGWFYLEHMKYEYQVELTSHLYYQLASEYDMSKKLLIIGDIGLPEKMIEKTHILYGSKEYEMLVKIEEKTGFKLPQRFFDEYGYKFTEIPDLFLYRWAQGAFDEGSVEMAKFYAMHGYKITPGTMGNWQEAKFLCQEIPCYPKEGSIVEFDQYIVVKLADYIY